MAKRSQGKDLQFWDKDDYIVAAKELGYPEQIIKRLKAAKSSNEATRIMITARHEAIEGERRIHGRINR